MLAELNLRCKRK